MYIHYTKLHICFELRRLHTITHIGNNAELHSVKQLHYQLLYLSNSNTNVCSIRVYKVIQVYNMNCIVGFCHEDFNLVQKTQC